MMRPSRFPSRPKHVVYDGVLWRSYCGGLRRTAKDGNLDFEALFRGPGSWRLNVRIGTVLVLSKLRPGLNESKLTAALFAREVRAGAPLRLCGCQKGAAVAGATCPACTAPVGAQQPLVLTSERTAT